MHTLGQPAEGVPARSMGTGLGVPSGGLGTRVFKLFVLKAPERLQSTDIMLTPDAWYNPCLSAATNPQLMRGYDAKSRRNHPKRR